MRVMLIVIMAAAVSAGTASAAVKDPRRCSTVTPGGTSQHAYWCARTNAIAALRTRMATSQHVKHWYGPTNCDQAGSLLRWRCTTSTGGKIWAANVAYRVTRAGWRVAITVRETT